MKKKTVGAFAAFVLLAANAFFMSCSTGGGGSGGGAAPSLTGSGNTDWKISYSTVYGTSPASKKVKDGYKLTAEDLPTLSKKGHVFNGWSKSVGFEIKANTTIVASWGDSSYTVTFDANGGSGTMESQTFVFGAAQALSENKFLPPAGKKFSGWSTTAEGSSEYADKADFTIGASDTTLYAVWIDKDAHGITYNLEGGTNAASNPSSFLETETVTLAEPAKANYTFGGWYIASDFSGSAVTGWAAGEKTADVELYAKWEAVSYTITYNLNSGANASSNPANFTVEDTVTLADPTRTDYEFKGWYTDSSFSGTAISGWSEGDKTANVELYAKWEAVSYTITYNLNSGTNAASNPASFTVEDTVTLAEPTRAGYKFLGWYTNSGFIGTAIGGWSEGDKTTDVELYAKWEAVSYTITYNLNLGTNAASNPASFTVEDSVTFATPTKMGYAFRGWYTTSAFTGTAITGWAADSKISDVELFAKWIILPDGFAYLPEKTIVGSSSFKTFEYTGAFKAGRTVELDAFMICDHEVTQKEYKLYCTYTGGKGDEFPVNNVNWYDALVYCNRRSIAEGLEPCYKIGGSTDPDKWGAVPSSDNVTWNGATCDLSKNGYRLPTDAEWECAARGGNPGSAEWKYKYSGVDSLATEKPDTDTALDAVGWYNGNSEWKLQEGKKKAANSLGLYDMSGNLREWCWDWYKQDVETGKYKNPMGADSDSFRVSRGGCYGYDAYRCLVAYRGHLEPYHRGAYLGFRVCRSVRD